MKKWIIKILAPVSITIFLSGCSAPKLFIDSSVYSFPEAETGKSANKDITIENKGNAPLKINNINISDESYTRKKANEEIVIYPNQKYILNIQFSPSEPGNYSGIIRINTNDPSSKEVNLQLQGKGINPRLPEINVIPNAIGFLRVSRDSVQMKSITISNTGDANLLINDLQLNGEGFSLEKPIQNNISITPGRSASLNIEFRPIKTGSFSGVLNIISNDSKSKIVTVSLNGERSEPVRLSKKTDPQNLAQSANKETTTPGNAVIEPPVKSNGTVFKPSGKNNYLGAFTHDDVQGTMKIEEGTMAKNSELSFSFEVKKVGDFEILVMPGYDLVSKDFTFTGISTFTDKSRYKRFIREKVQANSTFQVYIKRSVNSPDNYKFIFKLFPR